MEVTDFIICDQIQNEPNGRPVIINPLSTLQPMYIPASMNVGISIGIKKFEKGEYVIKVFNNKELSKPIITVGPINVAENMVVQNIPKDFRDIRINGELRNLDIAEEGDYIFVLYYNEQELFRRIISAFSVRKYQVELK